MTHYDSPPPPKYECAVCGSYTDLAKRLNLTEWHRNDPYLCVRCREAAADAIVKIAKKELGIEDKPRELD